MGKRLGTFLEGTVIVAIILVLVQTFLEDVAIVALWSWDARKVLVFTGFFFDAFFTVEFFARLYSSMVKGQTRRYLLDERGWIDFLASIPLLMFSSGPAAMSILSGGTFFSVAGILNVLKVVKAIRIARVLRLLRVLKIFRQIKYTDSVMAQRHLAKINAIAISAFVFTLLAYTVTITFVGLPTVDSEFTNRNLEIARNLAIDRNPEFDEASDLLLAKDRGTTVYSRYPNPYYTSQFGPMDYAYLRSASYEFWFDMRTVNRIESTASLMYFLVVTMMVVGFLVLYSPHFAYTITDPIHVMRRGFEEPGYNLEVRIVDRFREDDVFRLAQDFNDEFLPQKARGEAGGTLDLKIDDFDDLFS
jgi:hypothetical protein